jgi:hypothetical protein
LSPVRNFACVMLMMILLAGCAAVPGAGRTDSSMFAPIAMRIHPIFTDVKDWTGDGRPDGIEALLEFEDQFGDPTKANGSVIFELFTYRRNNPDPRGERIVNPWVGSLRTLADQQARWNRTSRTYLFQLECPTIRQDTSYVLSATFDTGQTRFFDQVVLQSSSHPRPAATAPTTMRSLLAPTPTTNAAPEH